MLKIHNAAVRVVKRSSDWILILTGEDSALQNAFLSLFNWGATSTEELDFLYDTASGRLITDPERMHRYFYNRRFVELMDATDRERYRGKRAWRHFQAKHDSECTAFAKSQIAELLQDAERKERESDTAAFRIGSIIAERPDDCGKAAWWRMAGA